MNEQEMYPFALSAVIAPQLRPQYRTIFKDDLVTNLLAAVITIGRSVSTADVYGL